MAVLLCLMDSYARAFEQICGLRILYICVSGRQIILKVFKLTSQVRMDHNSIHLILTSIAMLIHRTGTSIYTLIHSSGTLNYTKSLIRFLASGSVLVRASQASWQLRSPASRWPLTPCKKPCLQRCESLCFQHKWMQVMTKDSNLPWSDPLPQGNSQGVWNPPSLDTMTCWAMIYFCWWSWPSTIMNNHT